MWVCVRGGGGNFNPPVCFPLITQKTVKAVTLEFCSIQQHSIRDIRAKFGIYNLSQSPDIRQNSDGGISDFRISGQFLIKENCHNSRTSDKIDMKLGLLTKLDERNKTAWWRHARKLWCHCHFSDFWSIWSSSEAGYRTKSLQKLCFQ